MIILPNNWQQGIQVRDYPKTPDYIQTIGIVLFTMNNAAGQVFGYEVPVMVPTYLKQGLTKTDCAQFYQIAYNTLIQKLPDVAIQQQRVFGRSQDEQSVEVQTVADHEWKVLWDRTNCVPYEEFMDNLRS